MKPRKSSVSHGQDVPDEPRAMSAAATANSGSHPEDNSKTLPDELVAMLNRTPEEPTHAASPSVGTMVNSSTLLPEINSSPLHISDRWVEGSPGDATLRERTGSMDSRQSGLGNNASQGYSTDKAGLGISPAVNKAEGRDSATATTGKRAAVKSMFKNFGSSFGSNLESTSSPSSMSSSSKTRPEPSREELQSPPRKSLGTADRSRSSPEQISAAKANSGHSEEVKEKQSRRKSFAMLDSSASSKASGLQLKPSSATVSSFGDSESLAADDEFVAMLMSGASYSQSTYTHNLGAPVRRPRHRTDSQVTGTTDTTSVTEDEEELGEDLYYEEGDDVESIDEWRIGNSSTLPLSANRMADTSNSSLPSSAASSSSKANLDPAAGNAAKIRKQVTQLNLDRSTRLYSSTSSQQPAAATAHSGSANQGLDNSSTSSPATFPEGKSMSSFGAAQKELASAVELSARHRSQSESAVTLLSTPPESPSTNTGLAKDAKGAATATDTDSASNPRRPQMPGRSRSGSLLKTAVTAASHQSQTPASSSSTAPAELSIAVVGEKNAGKSTLIKAILRKNSPEQEAGTLLSQQGPNSIWSYHTWHNVYGRARSVQLLEVDAAILSYDGAGVTWPPYLPKIDGAMFCYDATNPRALATLQQLLGGFWTRGGIKLIVLACKSDPDPKRNLVDPNKAAQICQQYSAGLVPLDGGIDDPKQKQKTSFKWMCRAALESRGEVAQLPEPSGARLRKVRSRTNAAANAECQQQPRSPTTPTGLEHLTPSYSTSDRSADPSPTIADVNAFTWKSPTTTGPTPNSSPTEITSKPVTRPASEAAPKPSVTSKVVKIPELDLYFGREDLIDKLLYAAVTDNDENFVNMFLIIYRRFARPYEVLAKLMQRYEYVEARVGSEPVLAKYAHMKLAALLLLWVSMAPHDFSAPLTSELLNIFLDKLFATSYTAAYASDLLPLTRENHGVGEGPWALPDISQNDLNTQSDRKMSLVPPDYKSDTSSMTGRKFSAAPSLDSVGESPTQPTFALPRPPARDSTYPTSTDAKVVPPDQSSSRSTISPERKSSIAGSFLGGAPRRRETILLEFSANLLEVSEHEISLQLTRTTWWQFKRITPRDLIRHVMAPRDLSSPTGEPVRDRNSPVSLSIAFVNFLSNWVASLILVQSKARRRAMLFQKFIGVAAQLRDMENFDSLMGILAGLSSQPVARLMDTDFEELKDKPIYKKLRSLKKLMANLRGFSAYRMALASSGPQVIPYLGCHLQDITRFLEGKSDMKDGMVNWTKFMQVARSAATVLDCPKHAPDIPINRAIESLYVDCPVYSLEDDDLYNLSYQYRPRGNKQSSRPRVEGTVKKVQRLLSTHGGTEP